jgi:hypothetical protein
MTDIKERFWSKVDIRGPEECWFWRAGRLASGYGAFWVGRTMVNAHRVAWKLAYGEIPDGLFCCHTCDQRPCCNPQHLFIGTNSENIRDAVKKGRLTRRRGEDHPCAKLTQSDVRSIRERLVEGSSEREIAGAFQVSRRCVRNIKLGRSWAWLGGCNDHP